MSYRLSIPRRVNKRMEKLSSEAYERVDAAILAPAADPRARRDVRGSKVGRSGALVWEITGSSTR